MKEKWNTSLKAALVALALVAISLLLLGAVPIYAQTEDALEPMSRAHYAPPDVRALSTQADLVVIGQASDVTSRYHTNEFGDQLIVSDVTVSIEEALSGGSGQEQIVLRDLWSGQIGDLVMTSSDAPLFVQGERFVLLLQVDAERGFRVVEGALGKFEIDSSNRLPRLNQSLADFRNQIQSAPNNRPTTPAGEPAEPDLLAANGSSEPATLAPPAPQYALLGTRWAVPIVPYAIHNPGFNDANAGTIAQQNSAIISAADTWGVNGGAAFTYVNNGTTFVNVEANDGVNAVIVRNASSGNAWATAFSYFNSNNKLLTSCDIVFWDANAFSAINAANAADIQSVALHEFGHCLGLDHSTVPGAVMSSSIGAGQPRRQLQIDDLAGLRSIYDVGATNLWVPNYGYHSIAGSWRVAKHPRMMADVNGDGRDDVVGFGNGGVHVSTSTGTGFRIPALWVAGYGYNAGGWRVDKHPRLMADVNGDDRDDVVGFGGAGVSVSTSTGTGFNAPALWVANYGYDAGSWRVERHPRLMADVNGDGRADVVGFGGAGVFVSTSTGTSFNAPALWVANYGYDAGGWRVDKHPRMVADVNGDGRDDVVGFGNDGTYVSLSTGTSFTSPVRWVGNYGYNAGYRVTAHPRLLADVNADGKADVIAFGDFYTYVSRSTGNGFTTPLQWVKAYTLHTGDWLVNRHPRLMADVNGDGRADVVGFGNIGVYISRSAFPDVFN